MKEMFFLSFLDETIFNTKRGLTLLLIRMKVYFKLYYFRENLSNFTAICWEFEVLMYRRKQVPQRMYVFL